MIGLGPGMVEDELAVRIGLQVAGRDGDAAFAIEQPKVQRLPAEARLQAAAVLQSVNECVADEGVVASQCIPFDGWKVGGVFEGLWLNRHFGREYLTLPAST